MPPRRKPARRQVSTWQEAELLAADWMRYLGYDDAEVTASGPDGGIDVASSRAVAQVKFRAAQVGAPELQRLYGARAPRTDRALMFFTGTSYSAKALEYAEATGMALFKYGLNGDLMPKNGPARAIVQEAAEREESRPSAPPPKPAPDPEPSSWYPTGTVLSNEQAGPSDFPDPLAVILTVLLLIFPGLLVVTAGGALFESPDHAAPATVLALGGLVFYAIGLFGLAYANQRWRRRSVRAAAVATSVMSAPAVASWFGLAIALKSDAEHRAGAGVLIVACILTAPTVLTIASSWRTQNVRPLRQSSDR